MIKDRIWTLASRKFSDEATASELNELAELMKTQENADLYLQALEEFWKIPTEKDEEFLEATYHLHLNRLKEKGFDLERDKEKEATQPLYFDYNEDAPVKRRWNKALLMVGGLSLLVIVFFGIYIS